MYYLYIKTHNVTGLKYFGKTIQENVQRYRGSGTRWLNHIKIHGYDVNTEIVGQYETLEECKKMGIHYSNLWDIVASPEWANLKLEEADGGFSHIRNNPEYEAKRIKNSGIKRCIIKEERKCLNCEGIFLVNPRYRTKFCSRSCGATGIYNSNYGNHNKMTEEAKKHLGDLFGQHYTFIDPNGIIVNVKNLTKFCKENNLRYSGMRSLNKGRYKSHRGWTK